MRQLDDAIARGAMARVIALRHERLTWEGQKLLDVILDTNDPALGKLPDAPPDPYSPQAVLYERVQVERVYFLMRRGSIESVAKARALLDGLLERVGLEAEVPSLDGEAHIAILRDLTVALSQFGYEPVAIDITTRLIKNMMASAGLPPDISKISENVLNTRSLSKFASRVAVQLSNLVVRRFKLAYVYGLGGDLTAAQDQLTLARVEAEQSLHLRPQTDSPTAVSARLVSRANLARVEIESAALIEDLSERAAALAEVEAIVTAVLRESYEASFILPAARLIRATQLAMVFLEQGLVAEKFGDDATARSLAWTARIGMSPGQERFKVDVDESLGPAVRYGDACRLSRSFPAARRTWERSRERLVLFRGQDVAAIAAVKALDARLALLPVD